MFAINIAIELAGFPVDDFMGVGFGFPVCQAFVSVVEVERHFFQHPDTCALLIFKQAGLALHGLQFVNFLRRPFLGR
ncbi:hypothetical protein H096_02725 [Pseudomonas sp. FH1]|nr:hypothetical protein H096_02725 [Pseudomonas sp. FH1]